MPSRRVGDREAKSSRRRVLRALGAACVPIAGCGGRTGSPSRTATDDRTASATPTRTEPPTDAGSDTPTDTPEETPRDVACETDWADKVRWRRDDFPVSPPVVTTARLLVGNRHGVHALRPADGTTEWSQPVVTGGVKAVADGVVVVHGGDSVAGLDVETGDRLWDFEPPGNYPRVGVTDPVHDGTVYVGVTNHGTAETIVEDPYGRLYGLDLGTGEVAFQVDLTAPDRDWAYPRHVVAGDAGVFLTMDRSGVISTDHDGRVRWRRHDDNLSSVPVLAGDALVQPTNYTVEVLDTATGETRWSDAELERDAAIADGVVYGPGEGDPDEDGTLSAVDLGTGRHRWEATTDGCGYLPSAGGGVVAVPVDCRGEGGHIEVFDLVEGCRLGTFDRDTEHTPDAVASDEHLYVADGAGGRLWAIAPP